MALGATFQKLRGALLPGGLNSQLGRGEVNSQRRQDYFCDNILINYSYQYGYSNIFDIVESLIQNNHGPI